MKPFMKIGSFLMAVIMIFTALIAAGCTPVSLTQQWSYKTSDEELAIGVYIYSLDTAYQKAKTFASKLDGYDESSDSWLDMEITDDDGKKEVASKWIKDQAKLMCLSYLVVDEQLKKENAEVDEATLATADEQAKTYWNVGQYADYGYVMPMSKDLEPYGISFDSFKYCTTEYSTKYQALFDKLYQKGGSKEVSDSDLLKYFNDNYVDYSYFSVNLYSSSTDEAGQSKNVALSESEAKKLTDNIDGYVKDINSGMSYDDVINKYKMAENLTNDPATSAVEDLENSSIGDELKEAIKKLDNNKATALKVGSGDSAVYYLIYKRDVTKKDEEYTKDETKRSQVLASMKSDEFADYIEELTKSLKYEENTSQIDRYDPKMFFVKPEPTTAASDESSQSQ